MGNKPNAAASLVIPSVGGDETIKANASRIPVAGREPFRTSNVDTRDDQSVGGRTSSSIDTNVTCPVSLPDSPSVRAHDIVTHLFELGPSLLDPVPHDRFEQPANPDSAQYDIEHVRAKFPIADESLINRLGGANWERRQNLRRLRLAYEQHPAYARRLETSEAILEVDELSEIDSVSAAQAPDGGYGDNHGSLQTGSGSGRRDSEADLSVLASRSLTSTASTKSDFKFSAGETQSTARTEPLKSLPQEGQGDRSDTKRYTVLPPPSPNQDLSGEIFLCPYCYHLVSDIKSFSEWK